MAARFFRTLFLLVFTFGSFNCGKETIRGMQKDPESAMPAIVWQAGDGTVCEPGSLDRPGITKNSKTDVLEMVRLESVDNGTVPRSFFLRNYYYRQGVWYHQSAIFGDGQDSGAPALCTNKNLGNLEAVVRRGRQLRHYWRDETTGIWTGVMVFGNNVMSDPALICNMLNNNLEVVVREGQRIRHYYRDDVSGNWIIDPEVFANDLAGSPAMAQTSDGNLHVVIRSKERQIHHFERVLESGRFLWQFRGLFGYSIKDDPAMTINSENNRLQVIVKEGVGTTGLKHYEYSGKWKQVSAIVSNLEIHCPAIAAVKKHDFSIVCLDSLTNPCMVSQFNYIQN